MFTSRSVKIYPLDNIGKEGMIMALTSVIQIWSKLQGDYHCLINFVSFYQIFKIGDKHETH